LEKVFELFMSDKSGGTGMGLFIAKMLVETQLGGRILVQNTDEGVCFRLDFATS
jgi:signal transduction histidine kinase